MRHEAGARTIARHTTKYEEHEFDVTIDAQYYQQCYTEEL